jgi:hypothetical protein
MAAIAVLLVVRQQLGGGDAFLARHSTWKVWMAGTRRYRADHDGKSERF